jgi:hypothetical protein
VEGEKDYLIDHSASIVLINPEGKLVATFRPKVAPGEVPHVDMQAMVADFAHRAAGWRVIPARTMLIPAWLKDPRRHRAVLPWPCPWCSPTSPRPC